MVSRSELRMYAQSARNRWNVSEKFREEAIANAMQIIQQSDNDRAKIAAITALVAMERQNQLDDHKLIDVSIQREYDELDKIAADLGIETTVVEAIAREATGSPGDSSGSGSQSG